MTKSSYCKLFLFCRRHWHRKGIRQSKRYTAKCYGSFSFFIISIPFSVLNNAPANVDVAVGLHYEPSYYMLHFNSFALVYMLTLYHCTVPSTPILQFWWLFFFSSEEDTSGPVFSSLRHILKVCRIVFVCDMLTWFCGRMNVLPHWVT